MLPIILLLGPCGVGKGCLSASLIKSYRLYHLSVGDWLRSKGKSPILGVSDSRINEYVSLNFQIPTSWLVQAYGSDWIETAPPPLILYVCSRANQSTPSSMWIRSMSALEQECLTVSPESYEAILLDNFPKLISQSDALDRCFEVTLQRFLSRSRGSDDVKTFRRRLERFDKESLAVIGKYRVAGKLVEVSAIGTPEEVFQKVVSECEKTAAWRAILANEGVPPCRP